MVTKAPLLARESQRWTGPVEQEENQKKGATRETDRIVKALIRDECSGQRGREGGQIGGPSDQALTWLWGPWIPAAKAQGSLGAKDFSRMIGLFPLAPLRSNCNCDPVQGREKTSKVPKPISLQPCKRHVRMIR